MLRAGAVLSDPALIWDSAGTLSVVATATMTLKTSRFGLLMRSIPVGVAAQQQWQIWKTGSKPDRGGLMRGNHRNPRAWYSSMPAAAFDCIDTHGRQQYIL